MNENIGRIPIRYTYPAKYRSESRYRTDIKRDGPDSDVILSPLIRRWSRTYVYALRRTIQNAVASKMRTGRLER